MMTDKAPADSSGEWRMVTSGRGRVEHRSFLQLSVTHMKCKKWVIWFVIEYSLENKKVLFFIVT